MTETELKYLKNDDSFASRAVHVGSEPERWKHSEIAPPISLTTNYKQAIPPFHEGLIYSRCENPLRTSLETCLASLECTKHGLVFSSGMAAATVISQLIEPGSHVLVSTDLYYGVYDLYKNLVSKTSTVEFVTASDTYQIEKTIRPNTKLVWFETPTNPVMKLVNIKALVSLVKKKAPSAILACDNTFMSPYFQRPATFGVDIVMHSCSKYIGGHSDILMGAILTDREDLYIKLSHLQKSLGSVPSPFDCYLALRSLKTLEIRMKKHMFNALAVARFLENHPVIEKVCHPGLSSFPQHELSLKQCYGHSGIFSFYVKGNDMKTTTKIMEKLKLIQVADSLGGCDSTIKMPSQMPRGVLTDKEMLERGITDGLLRLSVGLESEKDLISDLEQALNWAAKK